MLDLKRGLAPLLDLTDWTAAQSVFEDGAIVHLAHPFGTMDGPGAFFEDALGRLGHAFPDLERRNTIVLEGRTDAGATWVGACGYYCGAFMNPFLDIPPTGRMAAMRLHEFYRIEAGNIVEFQGLWDIPELMMQAGVWPLSPSLGREWQVPGPATQDGLRISGDGTKAAGIVGDMLRALGRNAEGVEAMRLPDYWHDACSWYGPAGIGTARGIDGFRAHHQVPFLGAMPDRVGDPAGGHLFAEGNYVGFTGWPGMHMTLSGGTWLGIPGTGQRLTMRSLDFWRVEAGKIRENWVLVDLLDVYDQLGVDVLARMRELAS
ncbi:ester cyclase [Rhodophyticola sp.]|jgi:predicted ester cyclase|uniref:ester cyclase n=1 Tax=Rhodophyticola sp. TaxID=2680032 RepID=UPI003D2B5DCB